MKLSQKQLCSIIKEELDSLTQAPKKKTPDVSSRSEYKRKLSHLSELKEFDKKAYAAYVDVLVEDNIDTFYAMGDGHFRVETVDGAVLDWDPENTMRQWELDEESSKHHDLGFSK